MAEWPPPTAHSPQPAAHQQATNQACKGTCLLYFPAAEPKGTRRPRPTPIRAIAILPSLSLSRCLSTVSRVFNCVSISPTGQATQKRPSSVVVVPLPLPLRAIALPTPTTNPRPLAGLLPSSSSCLSQQTTSDLQPPPTIFPFSLSHLLVLPSLLRHPRRRKID